MPLSNPLPRFPSNGSIIQTRRQRRRQHLAPLSISTDHATSAAPQRTFLARKLEIDVPPSSSYGSGSSSGGGGLTPMGTRWTVVGLHPSTPVSAIASTQPCLIFPMIEVQAHGARHPSADAGPNPLHSPPQPLSAGGNEWLLQGKFADNRPPHGPHSRHQQHHARGLPPRRSAPCPGSKGLPSSSSNFSSSRNSVNFQRFREELWRHGAEVFGNARSADVFVKAVQLPRSPSEEPPSTDKTPKNPPRALSRASLSSFSASPSTPPPSAFFLPANGRLTVRAVLHSKTSCAAIGLAREFDLKKLQASIPAEPLPSPSTPDFDRETLFSALRPCDSSSRDRRSCSVEIKIEEGVDSPLSLHQIPDSAIPMHIPYARAQLPALAAIMMSSRVSRGDTIDLAVPHPGAWSETVAYVYTGEGVLLTQPVRDNILYLGGRV